MKLGTETASVNNWIYSRATIGEPEPVVGMGATILGWTDRNPATIVETFKVGKTQYIGITADEYKVISGSMHDGSAKYEFATRPDGYRTYYRKRNGRWEETRKNDAGRWIKAGGGIRIGERAKWYDPSF